MTAYEVQLTEEELKAICLLDSYCKNSPLHRLNLDIIREFGEPDVGNLKFEVYRVNSGYDEKVGDYDEVMVDWPDGWENAWEKPFRPKRLKRTP